MRLEHIPLIIGVIVALIGLGFIADASMAASAPPTPERRRRTRTEPNRAGEAVIGIGTLCMAAALFGRDTWRYGTVAVLAGSVLLLAGIVLNWAYLKEALLFRGPARRAEGGTEAKAKRSVREPERSAPRHPTPPVASPAYRAAPTSESAKPSAKPAAPVAQPYGPMTSPSAPPPRASAPPAKPPAPTAKPSAPPAKPPTPPPAKPPGSSERRRTPRGKK